MKSVRKQERAIQDENVLHRLLEPVLLRRQQAAQRRISTVGYYIGMLSHTQHF